MYISVCNIQKEMRLLTEKKKTPQGYFIKICLKFSSYELASFYKPFAYKF